MTLLSVLTSSKQPVRSSQDLPPQRIWHYSQSLAHLLPHSIFDPNPTCMNGRNSSGTASFRPNFGTQHSPLGTQMFHTLHLYIGVLVRDRCSRTLVWYLWQFVVTCIFHISWRKNPCFLLTNAWSWRYSLRPNCEDCSAHLFHSSFFSPTCLRMNEFKLPTSDTMSDDLLRHESTICCRTVTLRGNWTSVLLCSILCSLFSSFSFLLIIWKEYMPNVMFHDNSTYE